jgi:hypothetical protein
MKPVKQFKKKQTSYKDLNPWQKCVYNAFGTAMGKTSSEIAKTVYTQVEMGRFSADSGDAMFYLAKNYGFTCVGASQYTGKEWLKKFKNCQLILAITTTSEITKAGAGQAFKECFTGTGNPQKALTDESFDKVQWHAIYGKASSPGNITWKDQQGQRNNGPLMNDYVVVFTKA